MHSPYDYGWSPFRPSSGPLFDCQGSREVPRMAPFSINKWSPFLLTKTPKDWTLFRRLLVPNQDPEYPPPATKPRVRLVQRCSRHLARCCASWIAQERAYPRLERASGACSVVYVVVRGHGGLRTGLVSRMKRKAAVRLKDRRRCLATINYSSSACLSR